MTSGSVYKTRSTLEAMEAQVGEYFLKVHRTYLVCIMAIHALEDMLTLINGEELNYATRRREVKYSDVMFFYERLMQNYKLQVGTVDKIHTLIHPIFKLAVRDSIIRINPADGCMAEIKKKSTTGANKRKALTIPQQKAFIDYTQHSEVYYRWAPLFTVLLGTGCRVGEIIGLRWEDVDFAERTININHSVSYRADVKDDFRCSYSVSKPKTEAGIRNVPMLDAVVSGYMHY